MSRIYNVLFLCTGNSARSILAEAILNKEGRGQFRAFSAGSFPKGEVHPAALSLLRELGHPSESLRAKSWDEFAAEGAPQLDFIFTVCDNAAGEMCPVWPGKPVTAHWGIEDPATVEGDEQRAAFWTAYQALQRRIRLFLALPLESIDEMTLSGELAVVSHAPEVDEGILADGSARRDHALEEDAELLVLPLQEAHDVVLQLPVLQALRHRFRRNL